MNKCKSGDRAIPICSGEQRMYVILDADNNNPLVLDMKHLFILFETNDRSNLLRSIYERI
ncbi:hypothetical protein BLOT_014309 [Blomia tropicalis]|nr:hypothetical protein BLOT_014309 [Blomia tropicalis]